MEPKAITSKTNYRKALKELDRLIDLQPVPRSLDSERLRVWAILIERYEKEHYPMGTPEPHELIEFILEQRGLSETDLVPILGSKRRVKDVLAGRTPLTKEIIVALHEQLDFPLEVFMPRVQIETKGRKTSRRTARGARA